MSVNIRSNSIVDYFQRTMNYYLGSIWPGIKASVYHDTRINGSIFELKLYNKTHAIIGREIIDLSSITMYDFDLILKRFYQNFYYQARTSIILKSMQDNNLKYLTPDSQV